MTSVELMVLNKPFLVEYVSNRTCLYTEQETFHKHQNAPELSKS